MVPINFRIGDGLDALHEAETCDEIRMMADNHTRTVKEGADTWRTLYTYTKMDLPVVEVDGMVSKYTDKILHDVKKIVGVVFGMRREAMRLRPRSWKERECPSFFSLFSFFCAVYSSLRCSNTHDTFFRSSTPLTLSSIG